MRPYTRVSTRADRRLAEGKTVQFRVVRRDDGSRYFHLCGSSYMVKIPRGHSAKGKALHKFRQLLLAKRALAS